MKTFLCIVAAILITFLSVIVGVMSVAALITFAEWFSVNIVSISPTLVFIVTALTIVLTPLVYMMVKDE
jgi:putative effector of murein hydrolase LrgA (UPF0299 family)